MTQPEAEQTPADDKEMQVCIPSAWDSRACEQFANKENPQQSCWLVDRKAGRDRCMHRKGFWHVNLIRL